MKDIVIWIEFSGHHNINMFSFNTFHARVEEDWNVKAVEGGSIEINWSFA
jgi:hypothetical protein